jgi:hypothetical protein
MALIYTLLDSAKVTRFEHLEAALWAWDYDNTLGFLNTVEGP